MNTFASLIYGLVVMWTGIQRCIDAQAFKPNAFWFCSFVAILAIASGYLFRLEQSLGAKLVGTVGGAMALLFYVYCLMVQPEKDATLRVGVAIIASIGYLAVVHLPPKK